MKKKLPLYVWFGAVGECAMRLREDSNTGDRAKEKEYWRDGGAWGTKFKILPDGSLESCGFTGDLSRLNGKKLISCTRAEWKKDNGEYA